MKKRIYRSLIGLLLTALLLLAASVSFVFYNMARTQEMDAVRDRAALVADLLGRGLRGGYGAQNGTPLYEDYSGGGDSARMCVIAPDGTVLLDSHAAASGLENHGDREEFRQALETGTGEALRYSETLGAQTYYYALLLSDGNVLRISKTVSGMASVFFALLPGVAVLTLLALLLANGAARRLTGRVLRPLSDLDLDSDDAGVLAVYDELLPFVHKIERQRREIARQMDALASRADTIEAITRGMKEGLLLLDKTGVVLMANESARHIFGGEEPARKSILHLCRDEAFVQLIRDCLAGRRGEGVLERGGRIYAVHAGPANIENGAGAGSKHSETGAAVFFFDITGRHAAERQRQQFSANVSHELKTPLTTISALSEMLENGMAEPDSVAGFGERISQQARRLLNMIEDIMRLSEFDEGKTGSETVSFDLAALTDGVIDTLRAKAAEKNVTVRLASERPYVISSTIRLLDELLYNLIDNAVKYNRDGGDVNVTLEEDGEFCVITVADTGIGIGAEDVPHVFERFYRADKSRSKKTGGTGLGLSIVKHIAEHLGGRVELQSKEGEGTVVTVRIAR